MITKNSSGFTLIELLIAVTLSAILMTGIVVFVSSSLGSNVAVKNTLEERSKNDNFEERLTESLGNVVGSGIYLTGANFGGGYMTGIFLKTDGANLPITFLGLTTETGYCDASSGTASETGTVMKLALKQFALPTLENSPPYTLSGASNAVYSGGVMIIGNVYPGATLAASGIDTELSSPSALIESGNHLYIADTMNDRVLSYHKNDGSITEILGAENGIEKPNSLYFSGSTLLVASSGNGRIYSLADGEGNGSVFSSTFQVAKNFSVNAIRFTFPDITTITSPTVFGSFHLSWFGGSSDSVSTGSSLTYTFSGSTPSFVPNTPYTFTVNNISPTPSNPGNHTVTIDFLNGGAVQYSDTFAYLSTGDGQLESSTGNILRVLSDSLEYPNHITGPSTWSGSIDWNTVLAGNPPGAEIHSHLPVQDLSFSMNGKILTIRYHEYTKYDCTSGKHQIEERVVKVLLK